MHQRSRQIAVILALTAVYFLAARFGLAFAPVAGSATLIWPPAGIALAAVLLLGNYVAPAIVLGEFLANYLAGGPGVWVAIGMGLGNACEALVGAWLLRKIPSFSITLERVSSVVALIIWSAVVSTLTSATVGVMSLYAGGALQLEAVRGAWRAWWIGDLVGVLLIAPLILAWATTPRAVNHTRWLEKVALVVSLLVVCALAFFKDLLHVPVLATPFHQADLLVAVLLWAAIRFGQRGATTAVLSVSLMALAAAALGQGPFIRPMLNERLMALQTFMALVAATCLIIGATMAERRIANQEARHARLTAETANSAKSQFLRVMSHELRTPLNAIQGFAELLETGVYGALNEKQADAVKRIEQNEKALLAIINEMLGFVDVEKDAVGVESRDVVVAEAFDAVERLMSADVARKHLVVQRAIETPGLTVRTDPKGLQQILASFYSNATKYTGEGGTITLGADDGDGKNVRIWIRDTGIGIGKEEMERVFEPFFQADGGTTRQYSGVGLGLTIARTLAQRMSGEVTIESEAGQGTTVAVILPAVPVETREKGEESPVTGVAA